MTGMNESGEVGDPGSRIVAFYRGPLDHLSAVRYGGCPMHPSCSEYARKCLNKHGFIKGSIMAMDRLMRCGRDEMKLSPKIRVAGEIKYYDPVEGNDFWWTSKTGNRKKIAP